VGPLKASLILRRHPQNSKGGIGSEQVPSSIIGGVRVPPVQILTDICFHRGHVLSVVRVDSLLIQAVSWVVSNFIRGQKVQKHWKLIPINVESDLVLGDVPLEGSVCDVQRETLVLFQKREGAVLKEGPTTLLNVMVKEELVTVVVGSRDLCPG